MANGKAKGSSFERDCAKKLTQWASGQTKDLWFWRMPASGGMSKLYKDMSGDIVALVPEAESFTRLFSIEIKCHKDVDLLDYYNKTSKINSFWSQCCADAKLAHKWPLLIMKVSRRNIFIGLGNSLELNTSSCINIMYSDKDNLKLYLFKDFLSNVSYNDIIELNKEVNNGALK